MTLVFLTLFVAAAIAQLPPLVDRGGATARSDYVGNCGGCHGTSGSSAPAKVPELRDRVGYFMCLKAGRDYLVRLPNVAHAPITDNQRLAAMLNYMVVEIGGPSTPRSTSPYSAAEVAALRNRPLSGVSLVQERTRLVRQLITRCAAPASLADFYNRR